MNKYHPRLYNFQVEGVDMLVNNGGGFIWDEPGLGKTRQAIVAAHHLAPNGPILVVCPNALKHWWRREIITLYPQDINSIEVATIGGRFKMSDALGRYDANVTLLYNRNKLPKWTICHYAGIRISQEHYANIDWKVVIADECHYIKNRKARRSKALRAITPSAAVRIGLTATPFANNPADLWHQLLWKAPTVKGLQSYWKFFNIFVSYRTEVHPVSGHRYKRVLGGKNLEALAQVMHHYGLQRTKAVVAPQLPALTDTYMPLELTPRQAKVYEVLKSNAVEVLIKSTAPSVGAAAPAAAVSAPEGLSIPGLVIKNALVRLVRMEQWLSCPGMYDAGEKGAKLQWLLEWAADYNYPAVIVTRFRNSATRIARELDDKCGKAITGQVPLKLRTPVVEAWQHGETQFLVGTINTLGTGLNLERAHTLVFFDQVTSAILMEQARQRIHRITSDHPVQVIYLYIQDTSNVLVLNSFLHKWQDMEIVRRFLEHLRTGKPIMPEPVAGRGVCGPLAARAVAPGAARGEVSKC